MMERLTRRINGVPYIRRNEGSSIFMRDTDFEAVKRLADYEDTGLTPEMVSGLIEQYGRLVIELEFYKTQDHDWDADWYKRAEEDETYPLKEAHNGE